MRNIFCIGARGSRLALAQAKEIRDLLKAHDKRLRFRLVVVKTTGDKFRSAALFKKNNIGVFTKALEAKLLKGEIDIAVHSLKDLPTKLPSGLTLAAVPKRLDPRDVLISRKRFTVSNLPKGASVGTGSPRRKRQLHFLRPDLALCDIRGNLDTRIRRVIQERKYDAVVVARAGLLRLKKYLKFAQVIASDKLLPAVGQAALGLETRTADKEAVGLVRKLNHRTTEQLVAMERRFLDVLQGGCRVPVGVCSGTRNGNIYLKAAVFSTKTTATIRGEILRPRDQYMEAGAVLARRLLKKGAKKFLKEGRDV
ncbi:MAG: hydroxymethylbilane synthase [Candidatus Omnitrophica bacterium CG1_02_49_16]|nr:MAG: hydroxymethylbilane synthase [Candidatus Omnitrophica bacterium CG1_02_49_16]